MMAFLRISLVAFYAATATVLATSPQASLPIPTTPIVTLDQGKFIGTTVGSVNKYLGIPYAQPPSVVDFDLVINPLAADLPKLTELAICASVVPSGLFLTLANTTLLRTVLRALS